MAVSMLYSHSFNTLTFFFSHSKQTCSIFRWTDAISRPNHEHRCMYLFLYFSNYWLPTKIIFHEACKQNSCDAIWTGIPCNTQSKFCSIWSLTEQHWKFQNTRSGKFFKMPYLLVLLWYHRISCWFDVCHLALPHIKVPVHV